MKLTVTNRTSSSIGLPSPVSQVITRYATVTYDVSVAAMQDQGGAWASLQSKGYISFTMGEDPDIPDSIEETPLQSVSTLYKPLSFFGTGLAAGTYYVGGHYEAPAAEANLDETPTVATLGTANNPQAAKVFIVAGAAGTTDAGVVGVRVAGTSMTAAGVRTALDTEVLSADITSLATDDYLESSKMWIGQVTVELYVVSGLATVYSLDVNYGFVRYDDMSGRNFTLNEVDVDGLGGAVDAGFDIEILKHEPRDWTYSAAAFAPGSTGMVLAQFTVDMSTESDLAAGDYFGWLRSALSEAIVGSAGEGVMIRITTTVLDSVSALNAVLGVDFN